MRERPCRIMPRAALFRLASLSRWFSPQKPREMQNDVHSESSIESPWGIPSGIILLSGDVKALICSSLPGLLPAASPLPAEILRAQISSLGHSAAIPAGADHFGPEQDDQFALFLNLFLMPEEAAQKGKVAE